MSRVFLSYRRVETRHATARLYDRLSRAFGGDHVFRDVDSIPLGIDFRRVLQDEVHQCDIFVVVIGKHWLTVSTQSGMPRIGDPDDFVRIEIEAALAQGVQVLAVLVDDALLPTSQQLPTSLTALATVPQFKIRPDPLFNSDVDALLQAVRLAPSPPNRVLSILERLARAASRAAISGTVGAGFGFFIGLALIMIMNDLGAALPSLDQIFRSYEIRLAICGVLFTTVGGMLTGGRHFGALGAIAAILIGPPLAIMICTMVEICCTTLISGNVEVKTIEGRIASIPAFAAINGVLVAALWKGRQYARERAKRRTKISTRKIVGFGALGGLASGGCVALLLALLADELDGVKLWKILWLVTACAVSTLATMIAAIDGGLAGWRMRESGSADNDLATILPNLVRDAIDSNRWWPLVICVIFFTLMMGVLHHFFPRLL